MTSLCECVSLAHPPARALGAVVPASTCGDVTLCVALVSRKAVQGMCFHKEVIQE